MDKLVSLAAFSGLLIFYSLCANAQSPTPCTKHLQINAATQQKWNPGIVQDNSQPSGGIVYEVKIKVKKKGYIAFQNLIIENQVLDVEVIKDGNRNVKGPFQKNDELSLIARSDKKKSYASPEQTVAAIVASKNAEGAIV